jgi:hypothetical protein
LCYSSSIVRNWIILGLVLILDIRLVGQNLPSVAIYRHSASPWPEVLAGQLEQRLSGACRATILDDRQIIDSKQLSPERFGLLILCDARTLPAEAVAPIAHFVRAGGDIMALGGPAFSNPQWWKDNRWISKEEYLQTPADRTPLMDLKNVDGWNYSSGHPQPRSKIRVAASHPRPVLRMDFVDYEDWNSFGSPRLSVPVENELTCFRAKGSADTPQLAVEWDEKDGSRWIAVVALTPKWQNYVLPPAAFHYWAGGTNRGGNGDSLHMKNADAISFGLSHSHTVGVRDGNHTVWVTDLATAPTPKNFAKMLPLLLEPERAPSLELLSPYYQIYPVTDLDRLAVNPNQAIASSLLGPWPKPWNVYACFARPLGTGIDKHRRYRFVPLLDCIDARGRDCGAAAAMAIEGGRAHGGVTIAVPIDDPAFFENQAVQDWLLALARRALDGIFLYDGGTPYYVRFPNESLPVGATVINRGRKAEELTVQCNFLERDGIQPPRQLDLQPGRSQSVEEWTLDAPVPGILITLSHNHQVIDKILQPIQTWRDNLHPQFVTARDGHFYLDGKRWYADGINYMPTSGIGTDNHDDFEYWLDPEAYDPDVVERDLDDIKGLGLNAVSVFVYYRSLPSRNLLDLLMRCEEHGLKVNLSLRPGTPMDFPWQQDKQIIEQSHLVNNDTVFAYDLAWEPRWGGYDQRTGYDAQWADWVKVHYGNLAKASAAWGVAAPMHDGHLTGPSDEQVSTDGPWRKRVLDYRRFLNDLLAERYGRARDLIHSIDPHHLVSFRMSMAGDPTFPPGDMCYDFAGLAHAVDFLGPEGYGRIGDWNRVRLGDFAVSYGRAVAPSLPIVWAEFGINVWNVGTHSDDPAQIQFAGKFYNNFYRMIDESDADGSFAWYFAGGYRVDERSDFGVINPDRSWRPAAEAMHQWASILTGLRKEKSTVTIPISVGQYVDGIHGIYEHIRRKFFKAIDSGKQPVLVPRSAD